MRNTLKFDLATLTDIPDPQDLSALELADLRSLRSQLEEVENGLSYARRMIQGRLDTLAIELDRRRAGSVGDGRVLKDLPKALADRTRSVGMPRPPVVLEPPAWADQLVEEADEYLSPTQKADLPSVPDEDLSWAVQQVANVERQLSETRHSVHGRIDRIQTEIINRYKDGAPVDDLLVGG